MSRIDVRAVPLRVPSRMFGLIDALEANERFMRIAGRSPQSNNEMAEVRLRSTDPGQLFARQPIDNSPATKAG